MLDAYTGCDQTSAFHIRGCKFLHCTSQRKIKKHQLIGLFDVCSNPRCECIKDAPRELFTWKHTSHSLEYLPATSDYLYRYILWVIHLLSYSLWMVWRKYHVIVIGSHIGTRSPITLHKATEMYSSSVIKHLIASGEGREVARKGKYLSYELLCRTCIKHTLNTAIMDFQL